ncbi:family 43 glycosylhydrolase [Demequina sp. SYSU T00192]|uniref:Family 43 glycosylhydrolase n=1 Tax=Demequina litoralis TaxID=3051660 RepID=A0ABT8G6I2_9MICO|nr:family 43 glycosylhydrolase [Demequina sp. SYSU T00192]MDN4474728.1 family 43 glycosylhydrolase [Demequina sp. SYSU T00192]
MSGPRYTSFRPGEEWLDTSGRPIQAHGGSVLELDGTFYWYGENKERTTPGSGIWHWGVRCYSSTDLYNWTDEGLIIPPEPDDASSPLHPGRGMDRPHIVRHPRTGRFVCWIKVMEGSVQLTTTLEAESILGPYRKVRVDFRPLGMHAGDFDLVIDPDDGKGYYVFERVHSELIIADLTDDLTDVTGYYSTHFHHGRPPFTREAPAYFRRKGRRYLLTSGTTGYYPNASEVATARSMHGPWTVLGDPHPDDATRTSYRTQVSSVLRVPGRDLYIALGDRWLPDYEADGGEAYDLFDEYFAALEDGAEDVGMRELTVPDPSRARYVWLPLRFGADGAVRIDWRDEWRLDDVSSGAAG